MCVNETAKVKGCHKNAMCEQVGERHLCKCAKGYEGDGINKCEIKYCHVTAMLQGAGGASGSNGNDRNRNGADGGGGAYVAGDFSMESGEEILIVAGEGGLPFQNKLWVIGGGAPNNMGTKQNNKLSGGGGGASGIWMLTGTDQKRWVEAKTSQEAYAEQFSAEATILIAAGGGGGGSSSNNGRNQGGGAGGGEEGQNGFGRPSTNIGRGGSQESGGAGGGNGAAQDGIMFAGGASQMDSANGGGGGGGWYGGGGGMDGEPITGGGGGSSFINTDFVDEQKKPRWSSGDAIKKGEDEGDGLMTSRGRGGRGNGQRGQDGRVALIIDGDTLNPLIYETGAYIYKCEA